MRCRSHSKLSQCVCVLYACKTERRKAVQYSSISWNIGHFTHTTHSTPCWECAFIETVCVSYITSMVCVHRPLKALAGIFSMWMFSSRSLGVGVKKRHQETSVNSRKIQWKKNQNENSPPDFVLLQIWEAFVFLTFLFTNTASVSRLFIIKRCFFLCL